VAGGKAQDYPMSEHHETHHQRHQRQGRWHPKDSPLAKRPGSAAPLAPAEWNG
jgi:hypothetical protein